MAMFQQLLRNSAFRPSSIVGFWAFHEDCHGSEKCKHDAGRLDILDGDSERCRHHTLNGTQQDTRYPASDENAFLALERSRKHDA